jgi:hypothetical protein
MFTVSTKTACFLPKKYRSLFQPGQIVFSQFIRSAKCDEPSDVALSDEEEIPRFRMQMDSFSSTEL